MTNTADGYDEPEVLKDYIWKFYRGLWTEDERLAEHAILVEQMFSRHWPNPNPDPRLAEERKKYAKNQFVWHMIDLGYEHLKASSRDRILRESPSELYIHRCPTCKRVLASPIARQCLWCGEDWH
jgi:hypothetical protein